MLTRDITVTPVNDAPVLAGIEAAALSYTENDPATPVTATITISDVDSPNLAGATIQITGNYQSGQDVLSFVNTANVTGTWDAATGKLTLAGSGTVADYQAALRTVTYENTSDNPSAAVRTVSFTVNDGAADSNVLTRDVAVTPVNDAPVLAGIETTVLGYTEGDPATTVTSTITVSDVDGTNLAGATIQITGNYENGQDVLAFVNTANIAGTWDAATGTLTLTGSDTLANYEAALRAVTYQNTSNNPSVLLRTITFQVDDGAAANSLSAPLGRSVAVSDVNSAPVLTTSSGTVAYSKGDPAVAIDPGLTVSDIDSANLAGATIQITGNYENGEDVLSFTNTATITGTWDAATGTLTLTGSDTVANYQAALRSVTYENTSSTPIKARADDQFHRQRRRRGEQPLYAGHPHGHDHQRCAGSGF